MAKTCPACDTGKVCNHSTGRCVNSHGILGRILHTTSTTPKRPCAASCPDDKLCNHVTGRCVTYHGIVGRILRSTPATTPKQPNKAKRHGIIGRILGRPTPPKPSNKPKRSFSLADKSQLMALASKAPETSNVDTLYYHKGFTFMFFGPVLDKEMQETVSARYLQALQVGDLVATIQFHNYSEDTHPDRYTYHRDWSRRDSFIHTYRVVQKYGKVVAHKKPGVLLVGTRGEPVVFLAANEPMRHLDAGLSKHHYAAYKRYAKANPHLMGRFPKPHEDDDVWMHFREQIAPLVLPIKS